MGEREPWAVSGYDPSGGYDCMTGSIRVGPALLDGADYGQERCEPISDAGLAQMKSDARLIASAPDLLEAVKDVTSSLVAALSILERATEDRKEPRQVVASDKMFRQMLADYNKSVDRARAALAKAKGHG